MSYLLRCDQYWPSVETDGIGIRNGFLVPPRTLDDPTPLEFDSDHTIVTPGWINAHAHLELSGIPSIDYGNDFVEWIYDVMDYKESATDEDILNSYREATTELVASGVTRVADHCDRTDLALSVLGEVDLSVHLFKELIAFSPDQIESLESSALDFLDELKRDGLSGGLAPHAPYSAHPDLYRWATERVSEGGFEMSSHLHEVQDELDFTENNEGRFIRLLEDRTQTTVDAPYNGLRPLPFLVDNNGFSDHCFGVHINYTNEEDLRWLEASNVRPVFCPRSYSYFNHDTLPIAEWADRDLKFALGTDSYASNDSLNMLEELRRLNEMNLSLASQTILEALTVNPAEVLHVPSRGVMTWGTPADLAVFNVPDGRIKDLTRGQAEPLATIIDGEPVWQQTDERQ